MKKRLLHRLMAAALGASVLFTALPAYADENIDTANSSVNTAATADAQIADAAIDSEETIVDSDAVTLENSSNENSESEINTSDSGIMAMKETADTLMTIEDMDAEDESDIVLMDTAEETPSISYRTHVQNVGWQNYVSDGAVAGTSGQALRLEGINIRLENSPYEGSITYRTHIQNIGWESEWKTDDAMSGTSGRALRLEAIQIQLTGEIAEYYDVYYRVHAQDFGWLDWTVNGACAGTAGLSKRLEAIQIRLVAKAGDDTAPVTGARAYLSTPTVSYRTHVQNVGWQQNVTNGTTSGTVGRALRLEGIEISLPDSVWSGNISYRTHIQNIGWESEWKSNGDMSGTSGRALRLEAIQIKLDGELAKYYDIYYRVHAQNFGWLGWAKNGESAGTQGYAYRLEGIQIQVKRKGAAAPGSTANAFRDSSPRSQYPQAAAVLDQIGWDLQTAFNWVANNPYAEYNNWNDSASSRQHANSYFTHNAGDCYDMAAAVYEFAKALGYDAHQIAGYVPLRSGSMGPHSWVEIDINGSTYVCDPDFQHESGNNGYMIYYRQSGTWRYTNYYRMN